MKLIIKQIRKDMVIAPQQVYSDIHSFKIHFENGTVAINFFNNDWERKIVVLKQDEEYFIEN